MMKTVIKNSWLILSLLFFSCTNNSTEFYGKVKSVELYHYINPVKILGEWEVSSKEDFIQLELKEYNRNGDIQRMAYLDKNRKPSMEWKWDYNDKGEAEGYVIYDKLGNMFQLTDIIKISNNHTREISHSIINKENQSFQGRIENVKDSYLKKRRLQKSVMVSNDDNGIPKDTITYHYYYDGNLESSFHLVSSSYEIQSEFIYLEFDSKKNWIKRVDIIDGNPEEPVLVIRKIEYY